MTAISPKKRVAVVVLALAAALALAPRAAAVEPPTRTPSTAVRAADQSPPRTSVWTRPAQSACALARARTGPAARTGEGQGRQIGAP
jgi:hypothetical protein